VKSLFTMREQLSGEAKHVKCKAVGVSQNMRFESREFAFVDRLFERRSRRLENATNVYFCLREWT